MPARNAGWTAPKWCGDGKPFHLAGIAAAVFAAGLLWAAAAVAGTPVVVASKIDTEGALLGNMIAAALEAKGLAVERRLQLGPTNIVRAAILAGQIDIYPEYTGNGALFFHRESDPAWKNAAEGLCRRSRRSTRSRTISSG